MIKIRVYPGGLIRTEFDIHRVEAYIPPGKGYCGYAITDEGIPINDCDFTVIKHLPDLCDVKVEDRELWSQYRYRLIRELHKERSG